MAFERKFLINCLVNKFGCVRRNGADGRRGGGLDENGPEPYNIMLRWPGVFQLGASRFAKIRYKG